MIGEVKSVCLVSAGRFHSLSLVFVLILFLFLIIFFGGAFCLH